MNYTHQHYATVTKNDDHWLVTAYIGRQHGTAIYFNEEDAISRAYKFVCEKQSLFYFD